MQKPDDIPEDVWEAALGVTGDFVNYRSQKTWFIFCCRIARAILAERERVRHYAKSALNGFDTLDAETAIENAKSDLHSIILHTGYDQ